MSDNSETNIYSTYYTNVHTTLMSDNSETYIYRMYILH